MTRTFAATVAGVGKPRWAPVTRRHLEPSWRAAWLALGAWLAAALPAQAPVPVPPPAPRPPAPAAVEAAKAIRFTAPDGTRFVLVPDPSLPQVHWAIATLADAAQNPPGLEGLALATMRSSLGGTWRTGSLDANRERQALSALDDAWQVMMQKPNDAAASDVVRTCNDAALAASDSTAFRRVLAGLPVDRPEIVDRGTVALLVLTTLPAAIDEVARRLLERREEQALRELPQIWMHDLLERMQQHATDPYASVKAEVLTLAMPFHPAVRAFELPTFQAPRRDQALAVWQATQQPERSVHVLLGNFDATAVEATLRRIFVATSLPKTSDSTTPAVRPSQGVRRSVVPGVRTPLLAMAWLLPPITDHFVLESAASWLGDGVDSRIGQALRRAGRTQTAVSCQAPWPVAIDGRSLLLLMVSDPTGTDKLAELVLKTCAETEKQPPTPAALQPVQTARQRRWSDLTDDPRELATEIATEALLWPNQPVTTQCPMPSAEKAVQQLLVKVFASQPVIVEGRP